MYANTLFSNKVVLVTGGRSGIGYAIAKQMLQLGAKVTIISRKADELKKAAEELSAFGPCQYKACDIRKSEEIIAVAKQIKENYGQLDILVNNAGGQFPVLAEYLNDKGWELPVERGHLCFFRAAHDGGHGAPHARTACGALEAAGRVGDAGV